MVLTGEPSAKEKTNCLNILKANAFLLKPISLHHFHKSIQTVLKKEESKSNIEDSQKNVIRTILLVEDDKLLSNLIRQFLEGYEVIQAYTIEDVIYIYIYIYIRGNKSSWNIIQKYMQSV